ncbi:SH3 domain-containing protein [Primorskyibacter sp. S187A]|uniref:SH3 domain-containing protein n=1 Tax=Primorskyibacter sp. S187A TaxID=3415130 RepID=UPI003C799328
MSRFVILSFIFLGWSFYELSGGADYEPAERADTVFAPVVARVSASPLDTVADASSAQVTPEEIVTAAKPATAKIVPIAFQPDSVADTTEALVEPVKASVVTETDVRPAPATFAERVAASRESVVLPVQAPKDLRQITGNRVNMRSGPGTSFSVVEKLLKGTEVEVLSDEGDGWLNIRTLETGVEGYMADWLVTAATQ